MEVYVVLYDSFDNDQSECCGVFTTKDLAQNEIRDKIAKWGADHRFIHTDDRWVLEHYECEYRIETLIMLEELTVNVYVVLYDSFDGDQSGCYGVFTNKNMAENEIRDRIAEWSQDFRFTRTNDRWDLEDGECGYRIETHTLNTSSSVDIKEPEFE